MAATIKPPTHIKLEGSPHHHSSPSPSPSPRHNGGASTPVSNSILAQLPAGMVVTYPTLAQTMLGSNPTLLLQANALSSQAAKLRQIQQQQQQPSTSPNLLTSALGAALNSPLLNSEKLRLGMQVELCVVCGDRASGRHYGAISCEGCKGFFKRSIRKQLGYQCRGNKDCEVTKHHRNRCQFCRLKKCIEMGMRSDSVQSERKPASVESSPNTPLNLTRTTPPQQINSSLGINLQDRLNSLLESGVFGPSSSSSDGRVMSAPPPTTSHSNGSSYWGNSSLNGDSSVPLHRDPSSYSSSYHNPYYYKVKQEQNQNGTESSRSPPSEEKFCEPPEERPRSESPAVTVDGSIITESLVSFELTTPSPTPPYLNVHYICESASRLLFLSVHWARSIEAFSMLSKEVQEQQIKNCWVELFALGLAQCTQVMSLTTIFTAIVNHLQASVANDKLTAHRVKQVTEHIVTLQEYVNSMLRISVDDWEFAFLKALLLFSPDYGKPNSKKNLKIVQEKLMAELRAYEEEMYPEESERLVRLLLRLPPLRALSSSIMEELFFAGLIGQVQINAVIPYILLMDPKAYCSANQGGFGKAAERIKIKAEMSERSAAERSSFGNEEHTSNFGVQNEELNDSVEMRSFEEERRGSPYVCNSEEPIDYARREDTSSRYPTNENCSRSDEST